METHWEEDISIHKKIPYKQGSTYEIINLFT